MVEASGGALNYEFALDHTLMPPREDIVRGLVDQWVSKAQTEFRKTRDIGNLLDELAESRSDVAANLRDAEALSVYGVQVRYSRDGPDVDREESETALSLAGVVARVVLAELYTD